METRLKLTNISKSFGDYNALDGINLEIKKGEIIGFLGPSGAGKTTTIKIITGQLKQTNGTAELLGRDTSKITHDIYREVGIVSDNSGVYEKVTVWGNMKLYADLLGVDKRVITELLERVGLSAHKDKKAEKLSRGQKQRLVLVRALMHKPKILFLDEPTSGLDPGTTLEIHKLLLELQEEGMAIFLTTHDMEEATRLCNKVALLNRGKIAEYGTPKELSLKYHEDRVFRVIKTDGYEEKLYDTDEDRETLSAWIRANEVESLHTSEPNLEKVFLRVTGRELV
ncbi:ABC-2 type transport system ATP-binding protein [Pilibacter termitis]|uniref:ABC-2 type transport system ATP-binding protein n=1 Tax=Pilibacter termitis TaxID=263852 RepID=A0A1T4KG40_9ENTE|nr:ABC transporter ATP-binding protein [Pilibacter termitis]SJZ41370.1 ABC-2 type transport system ATP-binding protein [Pilibacter termitis]